MHMYISHTDWTADMLARLPEDGTRNEIIDGELFVTPSPSLVHQRAVSELALRLAPYTKIAGLDLFSAPVDITFSDRRVVAPDISVLPLTLGGKRASTFNDVNILLLAVEVISPSSVRTDREIKRRIYQQQGVADYWIVDIDMRQVERWTPTSKHAEVVTDVLIWHPVLSIPALQIDLEAYFREVQE